MIIAATRLAVRALTPKLPTPKLPTTSIGTRNATGVKNPTSIETRVAFRIVEYDLPISAPEKIAPMTIRGLPKKKSPTIIADTRTVTDRITTLAPTYEHPREAQARTNPCLRPLLFLIKSLSGLKGGKSRIHEAFGVEEETACGRRFASISDLVKNLIPVVKKRILRAPERSVEGRRGV